VSSAHKKRLLLAALEQTATGLAPIFTRTKYRARSLARDLEKHRYRVSALQGNMSQNHRQQAIAGNRTRSRLPVVAARRPVSVGNV
jgi:ATP-dependent RNA helicase RhlE